MADPTPEFTWLPDWSPQIGTTPRIFTVGYGDGYAQRMGQGLNTMLKRVPLSFSGRTDAEANVIVAFFEARGGCTPFTAQLRLSDVIRKFVTDGEWKLVPVSPNSNTITVTFQEVP